MLPRMTAFGARKVVPAPEVDRSSPQRLVIQSWRSTKFNDGDPDSTLILAFTPEGANGRIDLVHLDVPDHNYHGVVEGWETHYWGPWRRYLAG
jgi:hypothetical protein